MESVFIQWLPANPILAGLASVIVNVVIAVSGVLPSAFITAANIAVFGFEAGLLISITGEAAGAVISFILYRQGLKKLNKPLKNKFLKKLQETEGLSAVFLVFLLRILPFVPSGAVTLTAAFSKMGLLSFSLASTLGKVPSLLIEAYSVKQFLELTAASQIVIFLLIGTGFAFWMVWKRNRQPID